MPQIELYHLYPSGRYKISKSRQDRHWANLLMARHQGTKQAFALVQGPVMARALKPTPFESWDDLRLSQPVSVDLTARRQLALVEANNPFPLSCHDPFTHQEKHAFGTALTEEMQQLAEGEAARKEAAFSARRAIFMVLGAATAFLVALIGFMGWKQYTGGGTETEVEVASKQGAATLAFLAYARGGAQRVGDSWVGRSLRWSERKLFLGAQALQEWIRAGQLARAERKALPARETIIVYGDTLAYQATLPTAEIQANLDPRSRWVPDSIAPLIVGPSFAAAGFATFFVTLFLFAGVLLPAAVIAGVSLGMLFGGPLGLWLGPKFGPKPFWVMRLRYTENKGKTAIETGSYVHSHFLEREYVLTAADEDGGKSIVPQVYRATALYELTTSRDEQGIFSSPQNQWEKIEIGMLAIIMLACVGLLFIFASAGREGGGP